MTRAEAVAEAIRQGCSAVDAEAVGASLAYDFRTDDTAPNAVNIIVNRCAELSRARRRVLEAEAQLEATVYNAKAFGGESNLWKLGDAAEEELRDCMQRLDDLHRDYGLETR